MRARRLPHETTSRLEPAALQKADAVAGLHSRQPRRPVHLGVALALGGERGSQLGAEPSPFPARRPGRKPDVTVTGDPRWRGSRLARYRAELVHFNRQTADLGRVGPPPRGGHQPGLEHVQAVEELADLLKAAQGHAGPAELIVLFDGVIRPFAVNHVGAV